MQNVHRRPSLRSLAALALLAACAVTPEPAPSGDAARLRADVAWLADDAREGRRAGTQAGLAAADWLARRMEELGLEPAGTRIGGGLSWFQDFDVPLDPRSGGGSYVETVSGPAFVPHLEEAPGVLNALFCSAPGEAEGPLVFCGYGLVSEEKGWNDFDGLELDGAIAMILRGTPAGSHPTSRPAASGAHGEADDTHVVSSGDGWGGSATIFMKVMNAKRRGAAGVILLQDPKDPSQELLAFELGGSAQAGIPCVTFAWPEPSPGQGVAFTAAALGKVAEKEGGQDALVRANDPKAYPDESLPGVRIFADVVRERGPARNVLGVLRGTGGAGGAGAPVVVVGAHYDHLGHGGTGSLAGDGVREIHNGADDNASGTAAVLEIARLLKASGPHAGDVVFALWSGEELGLLGSEHWAQHPTLALDRVRANLNLDMVGRAADGDLTVLGAGTSPEFVAWLAAASRGTGLDLAVNASGQGVGGSDHQTFLKRQIPALHLFSGLHADYHRPTDDVEGFEADGAARVVQLSVGLVERMLDARELAYVEPEPVEGERKIESGFRAWFGSIPEYGFEGPGVLFGGISPGSPAEKAGLLPGDVLRKLGDVAIDTIYDFTYALQTYKAGDVVVATVLRDGEEQDVRMTLASRGVQ